MIDVPVWTLWSAFGLSLTGAMAIFGLSALSAWRSDFQFFPPPSKASWQHRAFLLLFRLFLYPLIGLTILTFELLEGPRAWSRYSVGGLLFIIGIGMAFWITFRMGWRNAFGEKLGLKTTGWFSRSRNPVYVFTWCGLLGWAMIANHTLVTILLIIWAIMYLFAPYFEEPWLEAEYGDDYRSYKKVVPRFL